MGLSGQSTVIVIPSELHYITKEGEKFEAAVETLMNAKEIGVSIQFEAQLLPRDGSLSLLCLLGNSGARLKITEGRREGPESLLHQEER